MTPASASPVVLGPDSIGLARDETGEPVVVLSTPAEDVLTILESAPKTSGYLTKVDVVGTTCLDVYSEIVRADGKHFASIGGRVDLRAKHIAVTADVWQILRGCLSPRQPRSGAEMLIRALPQIRDVRVMSDGRPGTAFIY